MKDDWNNAFDQIRASEKLKTDTAAYLKREMEKRGRKKQIPFGYAAALCSVVLVAFLGMAGFRFYQTPVSYISIDMNPSVELSLNRLNMVVGVKSYYDGEASEADHLQNLKNKVYTKAIRMLLNSEVFQTSMKPDSLLTFTIVADLDEEEDLFSGIQTSSKDAGCESQYRCTDAATVEEAQNTGLSFGKYMTYEELAQYEPSLSVEDCQHMSMSELQGKINSHAHGESTEEGTLEDGGTESEGNHEGHGHSHGHGGESGHE